MVFYENISGFLFKPYRQCKVFLQDETNTFRKTGVFVIYSAAVLSIIAIFFMLYPEALYYGVSFEIPYRNLPFITLSTPIILLLALVVFMANIICIHFLAIGIGNYLIGALVSKNKLSKAQMKKYLTIYGFSSHLPILLLGVVAIFWMYFFEKLYFATDISPWIDLTPPFLIFIGILLGFMSWKWIMEARINQAFFNTSFWRAAVPELMQVLLFFGFFLLLDFLISNFVGTMTWV
ncbi:MAG: hypothetical protein ACTSRS_17590 [Candidatus Helarchaeota archaeon]